MHTDSPTNTKTGPRRAAPRDPSHTPFPPGYWMEYGLAYVKRTRSREFLNEYRELLGLSPTMVEIPHAPALPAVTEDDLTVTVPTRGPPSQVELSARIRTSQNLAPTLSAGIVQQLASTFRRHRLVSEVTM